MSSCKECPFRKDSVLPPGELGGSEPEVYVGQILGPFWMPCHMGYKNNPNVRSKEDILARAETLPRCEGAASFRLKALNEDYWKLLVHPKEWERLKANLLAEPSPEIFDSFAQFVAHHRRIPVYIAQQWLARVGLKKLFDDQMNRSCNKPVERTSSDVKREKK